MKVYFKSRKEAREFAKGAPHCKVFDSSSKPFNGTLRWGVKIQPGS